MYNIKLAMFVIIEGILKRLGGVNKGDIWWANHEFKPPPNGLS